MILLKRLNFRFIFKFRMSEVRNFCNIIMDSRKVLSTVLLLNCQLRQLLIFIRALRNISIFQRNRFISLFVGTMSFNFRPPCTISNQDKRIFHDFRCWFIVGTWYNIPWGSSA